MSSTHQGLFDHDDLPPVPADRTLVIRPTATRPLNKQERAFDRAQAKVQTLRVRLEDEKRRLDQALVFHAAEIRLSPHSLSGRFEAMKTIGIVGGIGPESTIDYYRLLIAAGHTQIIINSVAVQRLVGMMLNGDSTGVADYLADAVETLARAGADVAIIGANTPHVAFDEVQARSRIPMVSIVEAVAEHVHAAGMKRVGLLGTRFTMAGRFYPDVFARRGLSLIVPASADLEYVHEKYLGELLHNQFLPETREGVLAVIDRMKHDAGVETVILGGTELPILLRAETHNGVSLLDTTKLHADAVLRFVQSP